jgi:AcrR family transcriptional regulator
MYRKIEDPRSVQSKNMLYRALAQKVREKHFTSITIKEVADAAQVGRTTFYRNFDDLESVLQWKCDETFQDLSRYVFRSMFSGAKPAHTDKFPLVVPFFRYWQTDSELIETLIAARRTDMLFTAIKDAMTQFYLTWNPSIVSMHPHFDYVLAFRTGVMANLLLQWLNNNKDLSPEEMYGIIEAQSEGMGKRV